MRKMIIVAMAALVGISGAYSGCATRSGSGVATALSQTWVEQNFPESQITFRSPWPLERNPTEPSTASMRFVSSISQTSHEESGLNITATHIAMSGEPNLDSAVFGTTETLKKVPGTTSVRYAAHDFILEQRRAVQIDVFLERAAGPQEMRVVVFADGSNLYQLIVTNKAGDPDFERLWDQLRSSIRLK